MRMPSRVTPYKKSTIAEFPIILRELKTVDLTPVELYEKVKKKVPFEDFVEVLDCLYILDRIELLEDVEVLHYVDRVKVQ
jgi:hypothetical protein